MAGKKEATANSKTLPENIQRNERRGDGFRQDHYKLVFDKPGTRSMKYNLCIISNNTPDRVPVSYWYDIKTASQVGFQAKTFWEYCSLKCFLNNISLDSYLYSEI